MANIPQTFNFGDTNKLTPEVLLQHMERMYFILSSAINQKPDLVQRSDTSGPNSGDGQPTDAFLSQGTININLSTNKVEMLTNHTSPTNVIWTTLS